MLLSPYTYNITDTKKLGFLISDTDKPPAGTQCLQVSLLVVVVVVVAVVIVVDVIDVFDADVQHSVV